MASTYIVHIQESYKLYVLLNLMLAGMYYSQSMLLYDICGGLSYRLSFFQLRIPITHNAVGLGESFNIQELSQTLEHIHSIRV
jgi:hypothetical protein